jgi:hypothetical protein
MLISSLGVSLETSGQMPLGQQDLSAHGKVVDAWLMPQPGPGSGAYGSPLPQPPPGPGQQPQQPMSAPMEGYQQQQQGSPPHRAPLARACTTVWASGGLLPANPSTWGVGGQHIQGEYGQQGYDQYKSSSSSSMERRQEVHSHRLAAMHHRQGSHPLHLPQHLK